MDVFNPPLRELTAQRHRYRYGVSAAIRKM
jgi:hypothetical protein